MGKVIDWRLRVKELPSNMSADVFRCYNIDNAAKQQAILISSCGLVIYIIQVRHRDLGIYGI